LKTRWVLITCEMLLAMLQRGYSYRVASGEVPQDCRVREAYVAGSSISLLVESESFSEVSDGAVPEIVPTVEFHRDVRGRSGILTH
jgi:hypothetical protein